MGTRETIGLHRQSGQGSGLWLSSVDFHFFFSPFFCSFRLSLSIVNSDVNRTNIESKDLYDFILLFLTDFLCRMRCI